MLVDSNGKVVSEEFSEIVLDYNGRYLVDGKILVRNEEGTYVVYDEKWKEKAKLEYEQIDICTQDGILAVKKENKWGFVNMEGTVIIEPQYELAKSFSNGLAAVCKDGKWGFVNKENQLVIDFQYLNAGYFCDAGVCPIQKIMTENDAENITANWKLIQLHIGVQD